MSKYVGFDQHKDNGILAHPLKCRSCFKAMEHNHINDEYCFRFTVSDAVADWIMASDLHEQWLRRDKKKIRIAPGQPINTSAFEEAEIIQLIPKKTTCAEQ